MQSQTQEQTLHATPIPVPRLPQILQILSGVTASPPQPFTERHLLFRPLRTPKKLDSKEAQGGSQEVAKKRSGQAAPGVDVWVARVVESYVRTESEGSSEDAGVRRREVRWYDAPDAGGPGGGGAGSGVTSRRVERMGVEGGDAVGVVEGLGYKFQTQYLLEGHRFTHQNTLITVYRVLLPSSSSAASREPRISIAGPGSTAEALESGKLVPLDRSGAHMVEAKVEVTDPTKVELVQRGSKELAAIRETLRSIVEVRPVERSAFDTRVR